jgi:hypothetical protein
MAIIDHDDFSFYFFHVVCSKLIAGKPPTLIKMPPNETRVAEGQNVTLSCATEGTPKPKITWHRIRDSQETIVEQRGSPDSNGYLFIEVSVTAKKYFMRSTENIKF